MSNFKTNTELRAIFDRIDDDGNGELSLEEVTQLMKEMNVSTPSGDLAVLRNFFS
jgi:Ca2+-binding EF-hand superfamily protein